MTVHSSHLLPVRIQISILMKKDEDTELTVGNGGRSKNLISPGCVLKVSDVKGGVIGEYELGEDVLDLKPDVGLSGGVMFVLVLVLTAEA